MVDVDFSKYYSPKPKQSLAHANRAKYLLYGGAMGSGKSYFLCAEAIRNAMKYAGNRLVILRKELSVARRTILISFFSVCPPEIIKNYNQSSLEITFINGSILTFIEANSSKDPLLNKLKGLEIGWFGIDEGNEVSFEAYQILKTRLRWTLPNGQKPRYEGRLTSNPEQCWLIPIFIQSTNKNEVYIPALTTDNYDKDSEYYLGLKEAFKDSPLMMKKYLEGDWSLVDTINQLIPSQTIVDCAKEYQCKYESVSLGVDPSRYGDDRTAFVLLKNGNIELIETYQQTSAVEIVTRVIDLISEHSIPLHCVGVDAVGIGSGTIDLLKSKGYEIKEIVGGAVPEELAYEDNFHPYNLRSQMYYTLRNEMMKGQLGKLTDQALKLELGAIQYEISAERTVKVVGKDVIKKVLGRSPDIADALCYANWVRTWRSDYPYALPIYGGR